MIAKIAVIAKLQITIAKKHNFAYNTIQFLEYRSQSQHNTIYKPMSPCYNPGYKLLLQTVIIGSCDEVLGILGSSCMRNDFSMTSNWDLKIYIFTTVSHEICSNQAHLLVSSAMLEPIQWEYFYWSEYFSVISDSKQVTLTSIKLYFKCLIFPRWIPISCCYCELHLFIDCTKQFQRYPASVIWNLSSGISVLLFRTS